MDRKTLLKDMRESIGTREPIIFFEKMIDVFTLLFEQNEKLEKDLAATRMNATLAIQWEPKVARAMITEQIDVLRENAALLKMRQNEHEPRPIGCKLGWWILSGPSQLCA